MSDDGHKRHIHKNEGGYALLIVMLALILISMFAVTFYTTSASHRLQQQQVESSTLSVGAAEMGVQRVHYELKDRVKTAWNKLESCIDLKQESPLGTCEFNHGSNNLNEQARKIFIEKLATELDDYEDQSQSREIDDEVRFDLASIEHHLVKGENEIIIKYQILGIDEPDTKPREILSEMTVHLPEKFIERRGVNQDQVADIEFLNSKILRFPAEAIECPEDPVKYQGGYCKWTGKKIKLDNWLDRLPRNIAKNSHIFAENLCYEFGNGNQCNNNWDLKGSSIYTGTNEDVEKLNNSLNGSIFINGRLTFDKSKGQGLKNFRLVTRSIDTESGKRNNGHAVDLNDEANLVLLGEDNKFNSKWDRLNIGLNAKACIVLHGLTDIQKEYFTSNAFVNNGKVIFYPDSIQPIPEEPGSVEYYDVYEEFLSTCGLISEKLPRYVVVTPNWEIETKVTYK